MTSPEPSPTWALLEGIAPESYFDELVRRSQLRRRKRIYRLSVVIWLMIYQRLHGDASLMMAILSLPRAAGDKAAPRSRRPPGPIAKRVSACPHW